MEMNGSSLVFFMHDVDHILRLCRPHIETKADSYEVCVHKTSKLYCYYSDQTHIKSAEQYINHFHCFRVGIYIYTSAQGRSL